MLLVLGEADARRRVNKYFPPIQFIKYWSSVCGLLELREYDLGASAPIKGNANYINICRERTPASFATLLFKQLTFFFKRINVSLYGLV